MARSHGNQKTSDDGGCLSVGRVRWPRRMLGVVPSILPEALLPATLRSLMQGFCQDKSLPTTNRSCHEMRAAKWVAPNVSHLMCRISC